MNVSYGGGEKPQYPALRKQIETYYAALLVPLMKLRASAFAAIAQRDTKAEDDEFDYAQVTRETIDQAIDLFLTQMAGPDRTRDGFSARAAGPVQGDGVIQEQDRIAFATGITRGADLMNSEPTLSAAPQSPAVKEMLDNAFTRLSENGKLRLEDVRDDIHGVLTSAQDAGLNPLETARQLGNQFDEYQGWEFQRLARTEAAFASEAGARGQMSDLGVEKVEWLISDGACPICEDLAAGGPYDIDDDDNLPPAHPNCLCSVNPITPDEKSDDQEGGSS